ncbi:hypothetical protein IDM40_08355 [Nocardiopsis sp. HNM0947]|uniref:Uncharacterized protein n=1 Tax=Nocardiopsis coralli TaxID=2772213 RepID=A0ABR9P4E9_9ACTN|nr:hypothetical protein [Nocardiopsis coralli]MBE2998712.1 hypothetical protein [Nocardiopsis coralli]
MSIGSFYRLIRSDDLRPWPMGIAVGVLGAVVVPHPVLAAVMATSALGFALFAIDCARVLPPECSCGKRHWDGEGESPCCDPERISTHVPERERSPEMASEVRR